MFVFIIPVKHPDLAQSWSWFSKLFERTVRSVCNQTVPNFRVVVVCNHRPEVQFEHPHVHYVEVDFPVPVSMPVDPLIGLEPGKEADKAHKIQTGLDYAQQFNPSYSMVVDADDCVSQHLVKFVEQNPHCNGWYVQKGYVYQEGSRWLYLNAKTFNHVCGTAIIIQYELANTVLTDPNFYDHYMTRSPDGEDLKPLPFPGAVYSIENGENYRMTGDAVKQLQGNILKQGMGSLMQKILKYRISMLTPSIRQEFGLYRIE